MDLYSVITSLERSFHCLWWSTPFPSGIQIAFTHVQHELRSWLLLVCWKKANYRLLYWNNVSLFGSAVNRYSRQFLVWCIFSQREHFPRIVGLVVLKRFNKTFSQWICWHMTTPKTTIMIATFHLSVPVKHWNMQMVYHQNDCYY